MSDIAVAAVLATTILLASMVSVEIGISVALIELGAGVVVGSVLNIDAPSWLSFLGSFAGILLTFLAGAEVDVPQLRREWKASGSIGLVSFGAPFVVVGLLAYYALGWNHRQAEIAGIALSTTSLAVVYAVLVETGLSREPVGKRLMSATFVTDMATVTALTVLFLTPTIWIVPFVGVSLILIFGLPRLRVVAFAFLTPFFFLKGGMNVSAGALWANLGILALLFAGKMIPKLAGVYPLARHYTSPHAAFTTLLMSTGLTFGTIASLYGLNAGIIDRTQFSLLIAVVVLSAIVPTVIAQRLYQPGATDEIMDAAEMAEAY
jgi:Kef-type K+ transport system membrane component KefB